ncbi:MAG: WYL domain-containing protein [Saprospiraceae bacterium]|nr:WYL domain-containing protein [Saprospiraceae bacterium]
MPTNKNAVIRYHALDKCFGNPGRKYYIEDLVEACNIELYEFSGDERGIKRRQIIEDIKFMESEQGWSVPLERKKDGKRVYFRYSDKNYSIKQQGLNESEFNLLSDTLFFLKRFGGLPNFEWMEEIILRLESAFKVKHEDKSFVSFEQNPYLKGLNYFQQIFNAIHYKKVLELKYKSFKQQSSSYIIIHPYYLKQYNSRWFLFGYNEEHKSITNLSLDRILEINETHFQFIENTKIDFEEYFEDVIGVTVNENQECEKILLEINKDLWPYIESKPIHGSQKVKNKEEDYIVIELSLQVNYELISLLMSFGENIKILQPDSLKQSLKNKAQNILKNYSIDAD